MALQIYPHITMKRKDFYIIRHGQTDLNAQNRWQGSGIDAVLNDKGKEQAIALQKVFQQKPFMLHKLYSSPLLRAVQTANYIADQGYYRLDVVLKYDLRECNFGDAEGLSYDKVNQKYGEDFVHQILFPTNETWDACFPNGESKHEAFDRVIGCLKAMVIENPWEGYFNFGVVCHAGVISALEYGLGLKNVSYDNCSFLHLRYYAETGKFEQIFD